MREEVEPNVAKLESGATCGHTPWEDFEVTGGYGPFGAGPTGHGCGCGRGRRERWSYAGSCQGTQWPGGCWSEASCQKYVRGR